MIATRPEVLAERGLKPATPAATSPAAKAGLLMAATTVAASCAGEGMRGWYGMCVGGRRGGGGETMRAECTPCRKAR